MILQYILLKLLNSSYYKSKIEIRADDAYNETSIFYFTPNCHNHDFL